MHRLVLVHGRGQEAAEPGGLRAAWLAEPRHVEVVMPFYGARLAERVAAGRIISRGDAIDPATALELEIFAELLSDPTARTRSLQNTAPALWVSRMLEERLGARSAGILRVLVRDVSIYLTDDDIREEVDAIVAAGMREADVVVGHSLGSVVAYRCLLRKGIRASRLVTLGSPLAIRPIRDRLSPVGWPAVKDWVDAADPRDIVALRPLAPPWFDPGHPIFHADVQNRTDNRHGIDGYLSVPRVAAWICEALVPAG